MDIKQPQAKTLLLCREFQLTQRNIQVEIGI